MTRYVTIRMTREQAQAASNACDLIRDQLEADGNKRESALYQRASIALDQVQAWRSRAASTPDNIRGQRTSRTRR
jgi:hypothetical protein